MAVFDITLLSKTLRRNVPLTAILPVDEFPFPGFTQSDRSKPFRSLYLLHGFQGDHKDWLHSSRIEHLAMAYNIAVFCPAGENSFFLDDKVRNALYEQYVCRELIDFTRRVFPLSHKRKDTSIGGLSMGGYSALRNGMKNNDVFGNIIALSSALITDDSVSVLITEDNPDVSPRFYAHIFGKPEEVPGSDFDPKALAKKLTESDGPVPNIYMASGTDDFLSISNRNLDAYMTEVGLKHTYIEGPGIHDWAFWDAYIENALNWLDAQ